MSGKIFKVKALYDFVASHPDDLEFTEGEVLTVTNGEYAEGWFYGRNSVGKDGMIPSAYVDPLPPSMPPPPLPGCTKSSDYYNNNGTAYENSQLNSSKRISPSATYENSAQPESIAAISYQNTQRSSTSQLAAMNGGGNSSSYTNQDLGYNNVPAFEDDQTGPIDDDWDDDWDSEDDNSTVAGSAVVMGTSSSSSHLPHHSGSTSTVNSRVTSSSGPPRTLDSKALDLRQRTTSNSDDLSTPTDRGPKAGGVGGSRSGSSKAMDYIMGALKLNSEPTEIINITTTTAGPYWEVCPSDKLVKCLLSDPTKQTKLKGMKKFLAYQLTSSMNPGGKNSGTVVVQRRYKHFDWLYDRLRERYPIVCIPPLPDKQVTGRYEAEFVHKRMFRLQHWMNRMSRHPVIGRSQVYRHFISETDSNRWKDGKRRAEKDDFRDCAFFLTLNIPAEPLDLTAISGKIDRFTNFALTLREKLKMLNARSREQAKLHHTVYKQSFTKMGSALKEISETLTVDTRQSNVALTKAIEFAGDTYEEIAKLYDTQPSNDAIPLCESLHEYAGIISHLPELRSLHQGATNKVKHLQDQEELGRVESEQVQQVQDRTTVVTYAVLAEMNNFQSDRDVDFSDMMRDYLQQQLIFYNNITQRIQLALERFDASRPQNASSSSSSSAMSPGGSFR
ncbi:sorting nexin-18-like [Convolutriloba macropyga]|uniref:sorting nexin-18-like n=1 Tax=Convolutriloba macropyga TaxID=536237 RepID=UPI003F524A9E